MSKCNTCAREKCFHRSRTVVGCSQYVSKQKTNADHIRAMSDEELAVFLWEFEKEEIARTTEYALERRKITEWLKQPADDLPKITDQTMDALEKMGEKAHGGE